MLATKLKEISRSLILKIIAFFTIIACSFIFIAYMYSINDITYFEALFQEDIMQSTEIGYLYSNPIYNIEGMLKNKNNEAQSNRYYKYFEKNKGIYYYATDGEDEVKNIGPNKSYFEQFPTYIYVDLYNFNVKPDVPSLRTYALDNINVSMFDNETDSKYKIYIGLSNEYLDPILQQWNSDRTTLINTCLIMGISFIVALLAFVYLLAATGRKGSEDNVHLNFIDKLYTDINLVAIATVIGLGISIFYDWYHGYEFYFHKYFIAALCSVVVAIVLILGLSIVRHIKNKTFIKHSLIYTIIHYICKTFSGLFMSGPLMLKILLLLGAYTFACIIGTLAFPLIIFVLAIGVYFVYINVNKFKLIKYGIKNIKDGDVGYKISVKGKGELSTLANNVNSIAEGLDEAVKNEIKSQRMKSELITNVSHDIKTPLTSIINYVDLLKKEGMDSENAAKYIDILEQKSQRLKVLTEDLFEAAKASSKDMPVELEKVDIFSLIQQGLAELEDRIEKSGLHFKINVPDEKIYVLADGRLLWRVVENLLSNVFKYALKGSRVYIDINENTDAENSISLTIKNISSYELNVAVEELMERFKRADESRSSEGSGLGLAIAKDLMEIQKGSLNIEIDGDLFKATVLIPKFI